MQGGGIIPSSASKLHRLVSGSKQFQILVELTHEGHFSGIVAKHDAGVITMVILVAREEFPSIAIADEYDLPRFALITDPVSGVNLRTTKVMTRTHKTNIPLGIANNNK